MRPVSYTHLEKTFGTIDILINNAGIQIKKKSLEFTMEDFDQILNVHIKAAYQLTKAVCPYMLRTGGGSVIFISSMTGFLGISGVLPYSAAKAGILGVMRSFTEDLSCSCLLYTSGPPERRISDLCANRRNFSFLLQGRENTADDLST